MFLGELTNPLLSLFGKKEVIVAYNRFGEEKKRNYCIFLLSFWWDFFLFVFERVILLL